MTLKEKLTVCSEIFYKIEANRCADEELTWLFSTHPQNKEFKEVFAKVIVLNSLYYTNIFKTHEMCKHILVQRIDDKLERGDLSVVDDIRIGHNIGGKKKRDFYSFATKFAHWHNPIKFPVYDNLIKRLLWDLNKTLNFHEKFTQKSSEKNYFFYQSAIDSLVEKLQFKDFKYRKIDKSLWIYAKYKYREEQLNEEMRIKLKGIIED